MKFVPIDTYRVTLSAFLTCKVLSEVTFNVPPLLSIRVSAVNRIFPSIPSWSLALPFSCSSLRGEMQNSVFSVYGVV